MFENTGDPDTRYEYIDGYVYAMADGTANHDTIKIEENRVAISRLLPERPKLLFIETLRSKNKRLAAYDARSVVIACAALLVICPVLHVVLEVELRKHLEQVATPDAVAPQNV